jgi:hypothetical protein
MYGDSMVGEQGSNGCLSTMGMDPCLRANERPGFEWARVLKPKVTLFFFFLLLFLTPWLILADRSASMSITHPGASPPIFLASHTNLPISAFLPVQFFLSEGWVS